jgi:hypothetical protein
MGNSNIFKGQQKPAPRMGAVTTESNDAWWSNTRPQWQPGKIPEGFNPVYKAGQTNPPKHPESTPNFALHKKED